MAEMAVGSPSQIGWNLPTTRLIQVRKSGIIFTRKLSLQAWEVIGRQLQSASDSTSWWIADWLAYGETSFQDRYREAIEATSLNYQTLRNYTWVARRFDLSRRRDQLSFGHHAEVAALDPPEQDYWLRKAEELRWSRNRLRNEVRASLRERQNGQNRSVHSARTETSETDSADGGPMSPVVPVGPNAESLRLHLTPDELARCEAVAHGLGLTVDRWAAKVLVAVAEGRPAVGSAG